LLLIVSVPILFCSLSLILHFNQTFQPLPEADVYHLSGIITHRIDHSSLPFGLSASRDRQHNVH
uniref:Uncharacterized protein n=1 Tax=Amphimedon queenslandica TaxID=400682 RepID=A0A1X7TRS9_AMPQE